MILSEENSNYVIFGGKTLSGRISTNTSKNSALGLMCASLLNEGRTVLKNVPKIEEVFRMVEVFESMGVKMVWEGKNLHIYPPKNYDLRNFDTVSAVKMRSVLMLIPALSFAVKNFSLPFAGGCKLGERTVSPHLLALKNFGINIKTVHDHYEITHKNLKANSFLLYEMGDTVTENAVMTASKISGTSEIELASSNYMVQEVCHFLLGLGVKIEGIGTSKLKIYGQKKIKKDYEFFVGEDPIESMLFLSLSVITNSKILIERCPLDFLKLELYKLEQMGFKYKIIRKYKSKNGFLNLVDIQTFPSLPLKSLSEKIHPLPSNLGINIDNLPFFVPIALVSKGKTLIHDWVYENRAVYYLELNRLRGNITLLDSHRVIVEGGGQLKGADVVCPPALRPAAIILITMLASKGVSVLKNVYSISRGYEDLVNRLKGLGADIKNS